MICWAVLFLEVLPFLRDRCAVWSDRAVVKSSVFPLRMFDGALIWGNAELSHGLRHAVDWVSPAQFAFSRTFYLEMASACGAVVISHFSPMRQDATNTSGKDRVSPAKYTGG